MIKFFTLALVSFALVGCTSQKLPDDAYQSNFDDTLPVVNEPQQDYDIRLTSPQENQVLKSPFLVAGEARIADDVVYVRVKKANGETLISEQTRIKDSDDGFDPFGVLISFQFQSTDDGYVEVYGIDPETSKEVSLQSVHVKFDTAGQSSVSQ